MVIDRYERTIYEARRTALKTELINLRQSLRLFKTIEGRYPKDLKELIDSKFVAPYKEGFITTKYLEPYSMNEDMNILDPFGLPYEYNPLTGFIRSEKKGFKNY